MVFGGDSASTDDMFGQTSAAQDKVWKIGDFLMGGAGSWRGLQLARYAFIPPKRGRAAIEPFMVTTFIDALRDVWKKGGHLFKSDKDDSDPKEETVSTDLMIGYRGELWVVRGNLQILKMREDYAAIGSGTDAALGALYATRNGGATNARVLTALRAAERYNAAVRGPFRIIDNKPETPAPTMKNKKEAK